MSDIIPEGILYGNLGVGSGTTNYNDLDNKPQINSVTLQGNKTASELGLVGTSDIPVTSVNGETGAVVLDGTEIEFSTGVSINEKILAVEQEIPVIAYPVTSVNGETGAVVLDGTEINYQAGKTINQKIDEVEAEIPVISYPVTSVNGETGAVVLDGTDIEYSSGVSVNSQIDTLMNYIPVYGNTASGAIATFDTSLALPLQDCTIAINAVQESGTPTPSSPKLISGFTGANITQAPVYERVIATTPSTQTSDGITVTTKANGLIEVNGTASANGTITFNCNPFVIPSIDGRTMRLNNSFSGGFTVRFFNDSTEIDYWALNAINRTVTNYSGMGGQTVNKIAIAYSSGASVTSGTLLVDFIANSTTTAISWQSEAGTVYGGSLDVTSGVLTVTHGYIDLGSISWAYQDASGGVNRFRSATVSDFKVAPVRTLKILCDHLYNAISPDGAYIDNSIYNYNNEARFFVTTSSTSDANTLKTNMSGWIAVFELATPVTYQLTPTQISAIVSGGAKTTNNVFTDTNGDTSVVYACSLKDYIDSQ